ncbi:hypothetical protein MPL3356_180098 [Mesorhizobium plurifarium]|uniref:Uncharacterized protein n=1 Tax=Mesorhizobium plurifarium TaxID=69974 RepID=A0A090DHV0_MESPL|nr:hypothetical protein MPL3356_180098 [Mesorhizobium plurifarium]
MRRPVVRNDLRRPYRLDGAIAGVGRLSRREGQELGCADIQVRPARERRLPALPGLTYFKYAPFRFSEPAILDTA